MIKLNPTWEYKHGHSKTKKRCYKLLGSWIDLMSIQRISESRRISLFVLYEYGGLYADMLKSSNEQNIVCMQYHQKELRNLMFLRKY